MNTAFAHTLESGEIDSFEAHHGFGMMGDWGGIGIFTGWIMMILFWVVIALVIVALFKYISSGNNTGGNKNNVNEEREKSKTYICAECGYEYKEKEWAIKCQKWCAEHKSCNMDIINHGITPNI